MTAEKKWLITGGCGFIGCNLVRALLAEGANSIRIVDNLSVGSREDLKAVTPFSVAEGDKVAPISGTGRVELVVGDIMDDALALRAAAGADVIVHLAANTGVPKSVENPRQDCLYNVVGTFNYLEAARQNGIERFVFASSGAPAGEVTPPIHEEVVPHPVSPYGASKLAGEGYCSAYARTFGIETVALRFGNVYGYGSGHKTSVVAKFIKQAMGGETLEIYGDGTQTRDYIYIDDLIRAVLLAASKGGVGGEVFQIATSRETTLNELVEALLPLLAQAGFAQVKVVHGEKRLGDVLRNYSDTSKAARMLGWQAEVSLRDGLRRTLDYFTGASSRKSCA